MNTSTPTETPGWIEWRGSKCPLPAGTLVDVLYRDRGQQRVTALEETRGWRGGEARFWDTRDEHHSDIIAYRIVEPGK